MKKHKENWDEAQVSKNKLKKPNNTRKNHIIYGLHAVRAALMNNKREHQELYIHKNHYKLGKMYESKIKKIYLLDQKDFKKFYGYERFPFKSVIERKFVIYNNQLEITDNIKSRSVRINADEWEIAIFLPVERFQKQSKGVVWRDSGKFF